LRNLKLIEAVITLYDVASLVDTEIGYCKLSNDIKVLADRLHLYSIADDKANIIAQSIIKQVKE